MGGLNACYRLEVGGLSCPAEMFGANAPGSTWHMTFDHADLGPVTYFVPVPADSQFNSLGNGQVVVQPKAPEERQRRRRRERRWRRRRRRNGGGGNGGGGGGGNGGGGGGNGGGNGGGGGGGNGGR